MREVDVSRPERSLRTRVRVGTRCAVLTGAAVAVPGVLGVAARWPLLTTAIGPTAYVLVARPRKVSAQVRGAAVGHAVAIGVSLATLAAFGLWSHPSVSATRHPTGAQAAASALAVGVTLVVLELLNTHHAPAATSALLVTTGLAKPGLPLGGLVGGLVLVLVLAPLLARTPFAREESETFA